MRSLEWGKKSKPSVPIIYSVSIPLPSKRRVFVTEYADGSVRFRLADGTATRYAMDEMHLAGNPGETVLIRVRPLPDAGE